jgi:lipopolysaccharide heptosyltransferase II
MKIDKSSIKKILCIKPRGIGDIILSTIILENLHQHFKDVKIDYLTETFAKDSLINHPLVNEVQTMGKTEFPLKVALRLRKKKYDMIIDLWSNPRSAQITFLSGAKYRVGFAYRGRKYAYNILATSERGDYHSAEHNLELLKPIDVPIISKKVSYHLSPSDNEFGKKFFENNFHKDENVIGIIPAGGWASKRCDAGKWVEICKTIGEKYKSKFLILWGPGDEKDTEIILSELGITAIKASQTDLNKMAALINECDIVLANDSGPMHISAALGKPTLGIFGPTNPKNHGPYSDNSTYVIKEDLFCIICNKLECPYNHECMKELPVEKVLDKLEQVGNNILKRR